MTQTACLEPAAAPGPGTARGPVCREIAESDLPSIAALLERGFPAKSRAWFATALARLAARPAAGACPRIGLMLEVAGRPQGVVLTLGRQHLTPSGPVTRCNVACWHMQPEYRLYGTLMYQKLLRCRDLTLVNVTPARATWRTIEAQGFTRFAGGTFIGLPALAPPRRGASVRAFADAPDPAGLASWEIELLRDHAGFGCLSLVCRLPGEAQPFVFRRRPVRRIAADAAQLLYYRDPDALRRCAGPLGRYLARRGLFWILAAADAALPGIPGVYRDGHAPLYARGPHPPAPWDLAYTELALFDS